MLSTETPTIYEFRRKTKKIIRKLHNVGKGEIKETREYTRNKISR